MHRFVKNWELCVWTPRLPKGLSWHTWKRHFHSFKNGFTPDNLVTAYILMQCIHLNSDIKQYAAANSWLCICCKDMMLITSWFWDMVTSADSNFDSSVLSQLKKSITCPVVLQTCQWKWGKSAPVLLGISFLLV